MFATCFLVGRNSKQCSLDVLSCKLLGNAGSDFGFYRYVWVYVGICWYIWLGSGKYYS